MGYKHSLLYKSFQDVQLVDEASMEAAEEEQPELQQEEENFQADETKEEKAEAMQEENGQETNGDAEEEPPVELGDEFRTIDEATDDTEDGMYHFESSWYLHFFPFT